VTAPPFSFQLLAKNSRARAGIFHTPHGALETPVFAPVGTQATVKALTPVQVGELGATLVLANTYHLYLRPGDDLVAEMGGLHKFMQWDGPILTDSGGFQVFSLTGINKIDDDGVTFKSHIDGSMHRFTPEKSIAIQENLGADIIMAFDQCPEPYDRAGVEAAVSRTHAWLERCAAAKTHSDQALFGIAQGGIYPDLREQSAQFVTSLDLPGYAIGGLAVGESKDEMHNTLELMDVTLPENKPRYLMGVGTPQDLIAAVSRGVDMFDCVMPTRNGRTGGAFTSRGKLNIRNAKFLKDDSPLDADCPCSVCRRYTRGYIRHLYQAGEMNAATMISHHNLAFYLDTMRRVRQSIKSGSFARFRGEFLEKLRENEEESV
jgi:queuine tRNA-ribosyltransferase